MAQLGRLLLLRQCPTLQHHCCSCVTLQNLLLWPSLSVTAKTNSPRSSTTTIQMATRGVHKLIRGLSPRDAPLFQTDGNGSGSDTDSVTYKSRNAMKRDARRAIKWATDLASFSIPQIKRILRVASLEEDVMDAIKLVKRLGNDVREGKRRQYSYIGKLLRDVDPELMDDLIRATKDCDQKKLKDLCEANAINIEDDEGEEVEESDTEEEEGSHIDVATRWCDGLIDKDINITNEVYSISTVEFDRQELRKLVRKVHSALERTNDSEGNKEKIDAAVVGAKKSLTRFLRVLAKNSLMVTV